jgi:hypothetical protein
MTDRVYYLGRTEAPPGTWTVQFARGRAGKHSSNYHLRFQTTGITEKVDTDAPNFWGYIAYLGGKFIENRQFSANNELLSPVDEAVWRARTTSTPMLEPPVGAVCWRFGSPPYDPADD